MSLSRSVHPLRGGIHPPEQKTLSNQSAIQYPPLSKRFVLPLLQAGNLAAEPLVQVGQRILKGQKIAQASGPLSAPIHAPTSGTVVALEAQPYPHSSGLLAEAIVLESDGLEAWCALEPWPDYAAQPTDALLEKIRAAGICGLGGAGFPTATKLAAPSAIHTLIINGAECEPYITADDRLMRERAAALVSGIEIVCHLLRPERVLIGIEDNKPEAIAAVQTAVGTRAWSVVVCPTRYPSGGERQLIHILTGMEVPAGQFPAAIGVLCQNVGTLVAIHEAVILGKPLISRIITLTGQALARPGNVEALLGAPAADLLAFAGLTPAHLERLLIGGPMMGFSVPSLAVPVIKTTNCLLAATRHELPPPPAPMPCIRCGDCADVCPAGLLPQQLHFFAQGDDHAQLRAHHLFDCIECGACAYVCPSSIPLVQYYRAAKADIREQDQQRRKAQQAKERFEQRQERLKRDELRREEERRQRAEKAARARALAETSAPVAPILAATPSAAPTADERVKRLKIEASMAQVALKKAEKQLAQHDTPELKAQVETLKTAAETLQQALARAQAEANAQAPAPPADTAITPPTPNPDAVKKAKVEAAMLRVQLRKLEKLETPSETEQLEIARLRAQLAALEKIITAI